MSRAERLAELVKREISDILREDVSDPRIGFVSLTEVDLSPDLKNCKVFISIFGPEKAKKEAMAGLQSATSFIRGKLAKMLEIRSIPDLVFVRDDSIERGSRVLKLINDEKKHIAPDKKRPKK